MSELKFRLSKEPSMRRREKGAHLKGGRYKINGKRQQKAKAGNRGGRSSHIRSRGISFSAAKGNCGRRESGVGPSRRGCGEGSASAFPPCGPPLSRQRSLGCGRKRPPAGLSKMKLFPFKGQFDTARRRLLVSPVRNYRRLRRGSCRISNSLPPFWACAWKTGDHL
jgi:hypothetical protein